MMIYFKKVRFKSEFHDLITVKSLETEASNLAFQVMPAHKLIEQWLEKYPEGGVDITEETK